MLSNWNTCDQKFRDTKTPKEMKNRIGVQRLVVMPSKLWRFEWSGEGIHLPDFATKNSNRGLILRLPKIGNFQLHDFATKNLI